MSDKHAVQCSAGPLSFGLYSCWVTDRSVESAVCPHTQEVAQLAALDEKSWQKATAAPTTGLSALIAPLAKGTAPKQSWVEANLLRVRCPHPIVIILT